MSEPEKPRAAEADPKEETEAAEPFSPLGPEVEGPINAAVQSADLDEWQGTEGG
jgi:hypothetical protein